VSSPVQERDHIDTLAPPTITASETFHATEPTDPVVTYARRSSTIPPGRQSTSPMTSTVQHPLPATVDGLPTACNGIEFPSGDTYVVPARSRAASTAGGDITVRKLLRTLSTVSIHESVEGLPGALAVGRYITDQQSEADAPTSEMPIEFAGKRGQDTGRGDGQ